MGPGRFRRARLRPAPTHPCDRPWRCRHGRKLDGWHYHARGWRKRCQAGYVTQHDNGLKIGSTLWPVEILQRIAAEYLEKVKNLDRKAESFSCQ